jgi:ribonuclease HII
MAWLIGIDEAGYGPNLGPLVMTAVACHAPDACIAADLWRLLDGGVRRHGERDDGRLVVADSKLVYSTARGMAPLEKTVLAVLRSSRLFADGAPLFLDLDALLARVSPDAGRDLADEAWYRGATALPIACDPAELDAACEPWRCACRQSSIVPGFCRSVVVCAPRFNDLTDAYDSKAAALSYGLIQLIRACVVATTAEPTAFVIDKHGGRNHYGAMLREALPKKTVRAEQESLERSVYEVGRMDRSIRVTFMPRADIEHFPVALASMISKYLREALMGEFNAFWQRRVPGLKATAGYPVDALRFFAEIRAAMTALGIGERQVWRRK